MNDISFNGGIYFEKPTQRLWSNIKKELPKHKCVFEDINDNGDKFISFKDCENSYMASLILKKKVKFKFYPNINLKTRLDSYNPQEALETISRQAQVIESRSELRAFVKQTGVKPIIIQRYRWKPDDHIDKTLKSLGLDKSECRVQISSGITLIKDNNGKIIAKASPNNERGVNFVYVYPRNTDESSRRFALSQSGETFDFGPLQILEFQKKFKNNVKIDQHRIRPQKG